MSSDEIGPRIEKICFEGKSAWLKRPEKPRTNVFTFLHKGLGVFLPAALQPTKSSGGMSGLLDETARLKAFAAASVLVPDLLEVTDEHVILSDCGPQLREILRGSTDRQDTQILLEKAVINLAFVHAQQLTHGRPHLKDMTLFEGNIYLLDLEEDPLTVMPLGYAQARDIWLLLASSVEFCESPFEDLSALMSVYQDHSKNDIRQEMQGLGRGLAPFRKAIGFFRASNVSRDVAGSYWATRVFENL